MWDAGGGAISSNSLQEEGAICSNVCSSLDNLSGRATQVDIALTFKRQLNLALSNMAKRCWINFAARYNYSGSLRNLALSTHCLDNLEILYIIKYISLLDLLMRLYAWARYLLNW